MERIIEGLQCAYCPKFNEERQIKLRLIKLDASDPTNYIYTYFNCMEQSLCEYFTRPRGCPFVAEVAKEY